MLYLKHRHIRLDADIDADVGTAILKCIHMYKS